MSDDSVNRREFLTTAGAGVVGASIALNGIPATAQEGVGDDALFSFVVAADPHLAENRDGELTGTEKFQRVLQKIDALSAQPDFMLMPGDIHPEVLEELLPDITVPIHPIAGNHEHQSRRKLLRKLFEEDFEGKDFYSFEHKGVQFIGICTALYGDHVGHFDSQDITPSAGQCEWLQEKLAAGQHHRHTVIFGHIPPEPENRPSGMCLGQNDSRYLQKIVKQYQPAALFFGHRHRRIWFDIDDVPVYGLRSCNWNSGGEPVGFVQVFVYPKRMDVRFIDTSNKGSG